MGWEEVYVEGGGEGRIMEYGGQKSRGAGFGLWWGCERDKEEGTKQLGWSLSLTSPSHQSSHHSLSSLSVSPCVAFAIVCFVWRDGERDREKKEGNFIMFMVLFSAVAVLAWSKGGRAQVAPSCSFRFFSFSVFVFFICYAYTPTSCFRSSCSFIMPPSLTSPSPCANIFLWVEELELWNKRYTCFSGREHFVGRPRPHQKNHHHGIYTFFLWFYIFRRFFIHVCIRAMRCCQYKVMLLAHIRRKILEIKQWLRQS